MLHLFNKVYVASDSIINLNYDRVIISEKNGNAMYEPLEKVTRGVLIRYGKTVEDVLENESFSTFIHNLNVGVNTSNKKIVIYMDDNNFCKFMSFWFKSIFLNPSSAFCWKIIESYLLKENVIRNWEYMSSSSDFRVFSSVTEEKFSSYFSQISSGIIENIKPLLSFEILLASYLSDGSNKSHLKSTLSNLLKRTVEELVIDVKKTYMKNYKKSVFPNLNVEDSFFSNSSLYVGTPIGRAGSSSLIDIIGANESDIETFKQIAKKIIVDWEEFKEDSSFVARIQLIDIIRRDMTDEDLDMLINFEKESKNNIRLYSSTDEEKINYYFLDFVLNCNSFDLNNYLLK